MISVKSRASILRWTARSPSLIVIGFLLLFLFGEGVPPVTVLHICFPFSVMLGLILAWFLKRIGAAVTIVSIAALLIIDSKNYNSRFTELSVPRLKKALNCGVIHNSHITFPIFSTILLQHDILSRKLEHIREHRFSGSSNAHTSSWKIIIS
jgi:hypothetical protein